MDHQGRPGRPDPVDADRVLALLRHAGVNATEATRLTGDTSSVWRATGVDAVIRVAGPDVTPAQVQQHLDRAGALIRDGVPFARPLLTQAVVHGTTVASVWVAENDTASLSYRSWGAATRLLHDLGDAQTMPHLPDVDDTTGATARLDALARSGAVTTQEHRRMREWAERVEAGTTTRPDRGVVVHDDLWAKNATMRDGTVVLLDPDNLVIGTRAHDLAFLTRGVALGAVSESEATAFAEGYGAALPDPEQASRLAGPHRLRWVTLLLERRSWHPQATELLSREWPD